jgi:alkylation response protein AidB-like acyl-CoA dehydrogenase
VLVVFAATDRELGARGGITAFIVEKDFPGFKIGKVEPKMGLRASHTASLFFEDCKVPAANVLGQVGQGFATAMQTLDIGRCGLGASSLGSAKEAYELALTLAQGEQEFAYSLGVPSILAAGGREYEARFPGFSAFHRVGLTDRLTAGLNIQGDGDQQMLGANAVWATRFGTFQPDVAVSRVESVGWDYGARLGYRQVRPPLERPLLHRRLHPERHRGGAGAAGQAHPLVLRAVRAVQAREGHLG